tara:strand:- start:118 stop:1341 length:1224 start_codon:yes stop_codon:yes gene_type:complete
MKGILIVIDGLGDLPHKLLKQKTPLEAAKTPNFDFLARRGKLGLLYPVKENFVPGTSESLVSMFGQDYKEFPRGWLEALGVGIDLKKGDLALRANFATINDLKRRNIIDRRAGRNLTTKEAKLLSQAINKQVKVPGKFIFKNTLQHRGVLVFSGGFSDNITATDPEYRSKHSRGDNIFKFSVSEDEEGESQYSANILNNFIEQSYNVLNKHPVNMKRRKKGFYPANIIITREAGVSIKKTNKFKNWACTTSVPVMKGICKVLGMNLFGFEAIEFKGDDAYKNLKKNLILELGKTVKLLNKNFDYFLVYLKETDAAGHDNKPIEKKEMIELIDKKLGSVLKKLEKDNIKIIITGDHSTPCNLKAHSSDPVPLLLCDWQNNGKKEFSEKQAKKGVLGKVYGKNILKLLS